MAICNSQVPANAAAPAARRQGNPLQKRAAELFSGLFAADRIPSVRDARRASRRTTRAQRLRDYLATGAPGRRQNSAA
jgi:hypothetical protein